MPKYATSGSASILPNTVLPTSLWPGDECYVWGLSYVLATGPTPGQVQQPNDTNVLGEVVNVGDRSVAVALAARPGGGAPAGLMVQISATADPGASEIDVQDAAVDADGAYLTSSASTSYKLTAWTKQSANLWTAWTELQPEGGRFVSLKCIANPNAVKFTAKLVYV